MSGPLAQPWRAAEVPFGNPCVPVFISGDRATFNFPLGRLTIDGSHVSFARGYKTVNLHTRDVRGAKVKANGISERHQQKTAIVLCFNGAPVVSNGTAEPILPMSVSEVVLHELDGATTKHIMPLEMQELVVHQINTFIESVRGAGAVTVDNDTCVAADGFSTPIVASSAAGQHSKAPSAGVGAAACHSQVAVQPASTSWNSNQLTEIPNTRTVSKPWQMTPFLPLAASRLSFEVHGRTLVVKCKPSPAWSGQLLLDVVVTAWLLGAVVLLLIMLGNAPPEDDFCGMYSIMAMCLIYALAYGYYAVHEVVVSLCKWEKLSVSPDGWTLATWAPSQFQMLLLKLFASQSTFERSVDVPVLGAKVQAAIYPRQLLTLGVSAHLHTAAGALPLNPLLNNPRTTGDLKLVQQEYQTLVATINRHLETVTGAHVTLQNDLKPTVLCKLAVSAKSRAIRPPPLCTLPEHPTGEEMSEKQLAAVCACNFRQGDRWVSTAAEATLGLDLSSARIACVSVSSPHVEDGSLATAGADSGRNIKAPMRVQFMAKHFSMFLSSAPLYGVALLALILAMVWRWNFILDAADSGSCAGVVTTTWIVFAALTVLLLALTLFTPRLFRAVSVEIDERGFWKVLWKTVIIPCGSSQPTVALGERPVLRTTTIAEGTIEELRGCEIRWGVSNSLGVRMCWTSELVLHYHPVAEAEPKQLSLAGHPNRALINLTEKLMVAEAINSAAAAFDSRFRPDPSTAQLQPDAIAVASEQDDATVDRLKAGTEKEALLRCEP